MTPTTWAVVQELGAPQTFCDGMVRIAIAEESQVISGMRLSTYAFRLVNMSPYKLQVDVWLNPDNISASARAFSGGPYYASTVLQVIQAIELPMKGSFINGPPALQASALLDAKCTRMP